MWTLLLTCGAHTILRALTNLHAHMSVCARARACMHARACVRACMVVASPAEAGQAEHWEVPLLLNLGAPVPRAGQPPVYA